MLITYIVISIFIIVMEVVVRLVYFVRDITYIVMKISIVELLTLALISNI